MRCGGDAAGAASDLEALERDFMVSRQPMLRLMLLEARLAARTAVADQTEVEEVTAEYEQTRHRFPSSARDLRVYRSLAR